MRVVRYVFLCLLISLCQISLGQYQFPNDAKERLRSEVEQYSNLINSNKNLQFEITVKTTRGDISSGLRKTDYFIVDSLVIIKSHDMEYFIDDQYVVMINNKDHKIYVKNLEAKNVARAAYSNLVANFDSIMSYSSSIHYINRGGQIEYKMEIAPENYYVFDNLMAQKVYYEEGKVLPDSVIKVYYGEDMMTTEVSTIKLISKLAPAHYSYKKAEEYVFQKDHILRPKYKNYTFLTL
jgi:hypothetical protein